MLKTQGGRKKGKRFYVILDGDKKIADGIYSIDPVSIYKTKKWAIRNKLEGEEVVPVTVTIVSNKNKITK